MHIRKGRGRGRKEGRGGGMMEIWSWWTKKGLRWREDGCIASMDPLSPAVKDQDLHSFAKSLAYSCYT